MAFLREPSYFGWSPAFGEPAPTPAPAPVPDSPVATRFIEAHRSRWCVPGQRGSDTCRRIRAPRAIERVVIHTTAIGKTCGPAVNVEETVARWQRQSSRQSGPHYVVDRDGTITQLVREANVAFHKMGGGVNRNSIGIEHADICNAPDAYTPTLYECSAKLVRDIARRNGFPLRVFKIDTSNLADATVIGHDSFGGHGDPGVYWDWEYYAQLLHWDGSANTRPIRIVAASPGDPAPAGWQLRTRVQHPVPIQRARAGTLQGVAMVATACRRLLRDARRFRSAEGGRPCARVGLLRPAPQFREME